ncbi:MAG: type 1 glutamine amidotransferase [Actinobacteria bacterium]|uniref:Unannotated protein n=1 Tax=freshwater metagenome TaxID=449393 RepID=A0A6J6S5X8_9ZZZZ|nr:type 1 glutamine amidotransferase [Actinomycetota bacterium]
MTRVLVVQHEDDCPPALVGAWLEGVGCVLDVRRPYAGDPLPAGLDDHDALLVLGGPMGADDEADHAWLAPTKDLVRLALRDEVALLGICLGHQIITSAMGGAIGRNPLGRQVGLLPVAWTEAASDDELVGLLGSGRRGLHWNDDIALTLPPGAVVLATAPAGEPQVVRFGRRAWGVQHHPEVDEVVVGLWVQWSDEHESDDGGPGRAADSAALLGELRGARSELDEAWRPLAESFARVARGSHPA